MNEVMSGWVLFVPIALSLASSGLAGLLWSVKYANPFYRSVATVLGLTGLIGIGDSLIFMDSDRAVLWHSMVLLGELLQPAAFLYVSAALFNPVESGSRTSILWRARAATGLGSLLVLLDWWGVVSSGTHGGGLPLVDPRTAGHVDSSFIIIALVIGMAYLEQCVRAMRDPLRYQVKFVLIGLGALAVVQIYHASQFLGVPVQEAHAVLIRSLGSLIAVGLIAFGLVRTRLRETAAAVYVAPGVLHGSVTFIAVGVYLFVVGMLGELIRYSGLPLSDVLSRLTIFAAAIALVVLAASRSVRARMSQWVSRRFYYAKYDYRAKWQEVTEVFLDSHSEDAILDRLLDLLGRTFPAGRISVWSRVEADSRFHQVRSANTTIAPEPLDELHGVICRLAVVDVPVDVLTLGLPAGDSFVMATQAALCAPIRSDAELLGFIALSREVGGKGYGQDDRDLLRAIAHHVGVLLAHSRLAEEQQGRAELEALHRFSAFCLHDLKNLAARLSLVVQNAEQHGRDPLFQESAMRTVADTVHKMTALISKLSYKSLKPMPPIATEPVDVSALLGDLVRLIARDDHVHVRVVGEPLPPTMGVREQLYQVLLNVLLNAKQAIGHGGEIVITQSQRSGSVIVTVADTGCGIPIARQRLLFRPTQSSKPGGLGIGLYQCKQTVEAHSGTIQIISTEGKGTQVRIELPLCPAPAVAHNSPVASGTVHPHV